MDSTEEAVSSMMDAWLSLRNVEYNGERNRTLYLLKARGIAHSNQVREFLLTDTGVRLRDVYVGAAGVLTGTARVAQEAMEQAEETLRQQEFERKRQELERKRQTLHAQMESVRLEIEATEKELESAALIEESREEAEARARARIVTSRTVERPGDDSAETDQERCA